MTDARLLAPPPSRILRPGLPARAAGTERHRVAGRGSLVVAVQAGDRLALTDVEGGQVCELMFCDASGAFAPGALGDADTLRAAEASVVTPDGFLALMAEGGPVVARTLTALARRGIALAEARGLRLFGRGSRAGARADFTVQRDGFLIVATPGTRMDFVAGDAATPVELTLVRAAAQVDAAAIALPEPLADPRFEQRIAAGTAHAYVVKAGEYIQVLDVQGRQCSDFQAFSLRKLEQGIERGLDATVTRTLLGAAYPQPGLPAKAFDRDFEPLIEVVQDTVGRHDAFATACGARYYDDMGYPGHVNCSDNFSAALAPYGVAPRRGWEALNFFYNTFLCSAHQLHLDEPWSRPGDYVLMRALTDLVCVTSSCPDDIDPANGWNPTDIHVRTYAPDAGFPRAIAHRMTPDADPKLTRESPFHSRTSALTRHFVDYRGYWLPTRFAGEGAISEYWACREAVAVIDLSAMRKIEITGPDAEALLQWALTKDVSKLGPGKVAHVALCHPNGNVLDDALLYRICVNNFRLVCSEDTVGPWLRRQIQEQGYNAWARESTDQLCNLAVQGPRARDLMRQIVWTAPAQPSIDELKWLRFVPARIGGYEGMPIVLSRTGYTGELGYEIFCHPRDAEGVWDAIWQAGQPLGLKPMGLDALDLVRIEAGLAAAGNEFDARTDGWEGWVGDAISLDKPCDFIGRAVLAERAEHPRKLIVGFQLEGGEAVSHGDEFFLGRVPVGVVTSAMRSPKLGRTVGIARIDAQYAAPGTELEIGTLDGHQKRLPARLTNLPHYDPERLRPRA
ncbi:DUF1989 domain-containing protein [Derxia gummosa]|uniref:DUF1989 domain-containing protein n=1 Tax=Derxia gummosa DSM 723 TaxID=1121388 RepID=A0A8B6X3G4_9BURK|nr:aminomethyltransferase family protein [Derxia gummosa]